MKVHVCHTCDLEPAKAVRALLDAAFDGDFSDADWDHALGGMHALAWHDGELIGHASVVQRRLIHQDRALRAGYVEGVAVRADHRRRGVGAAMMAQLERIIRGAYDLGALASSAMAIPFYEARGWQRWQGPTWALTPDGITRTEDDDVFVLAAATVDVHAALTCDWRDGDVW